MTSIGVGAWILHHFGMPGETIAERQFNLSFLNTALDALALIVFGLGLAVFGGEHNLLLTVVPACVAATGIVVVLLISRRASTYAERLEPKHPKVAVSITSVANAVDCTKRVITSNRRAKSRLPAPHVIDACGRRTRIVQFVMICI